MESNCGETLATFPFQFVRQDFTISPFTVFSLFLTYSPSHSSFDCLWKSTRCPFKLCRLSVFSFYVLHRTHDFNNEYICYSFHMHNYGIVIHLLTIMLLLMIFNIRSLKFKCISYFKLG